MNLNDVRAIRVARKKRHRVGRGVGSGWGTTAGRGNKGQHSRTGSRIRLRFEGGQMPIYRRLPKKGFSNARFKLVYHVVNVGDLDRAFDAGATVSMETVKAAGLAPKRARHLKVLGFGDLTKALTVRAHAMSEGARKKVMDASGSVDLVALPGAETQQKAAERKGTRAPTGAGGNRAEGKASGGKPSASKDGKAGGARKGAGSGEETDAS
jgi:large subunit ribosomal protein L15